MHWLDELGSWHETWQLLSFWLGHAFCKFIDAPTVWHCLSSDVQTPLAQASPPDPQLWPFGENWSSGHADELPVHISAWSQLASFAGRHTWVAGANEQVSVQQALLAGSHCAFALSLHVEASQHDEVTPWPGSHSSPCSTMPLPHMPSEIVRWAAEASMRHDVLVLPPLLPCIREQILPRLHGENFISPVSATGFMMNWELALQLSFVKGQHTGELLVPQPSVQSWIAPKLCPIS